MSYLIDTCVFSEYKKPVPEPRVLDWIADQDDQTISVSVLTFGELEKGINRMPESDRKRTLTLYLGDLQQRYGSNILDLDLRVLRRWASMIASLESKGRPMPVIDSLIAATALEHNLTLVTRNEQDFADTGVTVLNIWK
jgi:tRNA(fMet)-specific endonuclease VapC